jgi:hypothetical protein
VSRINALAEQMGVGESDYADDSYDAETPAPCRGCGAAYCDSRCGVFDMEAVPCRGCGRRDCDSECAEFREWLTVAWLTVDAIERDGAA